MTLASYNLNTPCDKVILRITSREITRRRNGAYKTEIWGMTRQNFSGGMQNFSNLSI